MDKKILAFITVLVLVILGGVFFLLNDSKDTVTSKNTNIVNDSEKLESDPETAVSNSNNSAGTYVDYEEVVIADISGTKLLFFHASWCPQCRDLESDIEKNGVPEGVTIIKVDYDSNQALRQKYGVTLQTTVVRIDDAGELVSKFVAYEEPTVDAVKANLL
jgi:thiol-disulfide isomerase/thioredoxin